MSIHEFIICPNCGAKITYAAGDPPRRCVAKKKNIFGKRKICGLKFIKKNGIGNAVSEKRFKQAIIKPKRVQLNDKERLCR